jgi:hypothetical protein
MPYRLPYNLWHSILVPLCQRSSNLRKNFLDRVTDCKKSRLVSIIQQFSKKFRSHLTILGDMKEVPYWGPKKLGAALKNLVARATWRRDLCTTELCFISWKIMYLKCTSSLHYHKKLTFTLLQASRYWRGGRSVALSILNLNTRRVWVVSTTPRPLYHRKKPGTHCTGGWVGPRTGLDVYEKPRPHWNSIPGPSRP